MLSGCNELIHHEVLQEMIFNYMLQHLQITEVRLTGLYLEGKCLSPFLCNAVTNVSFQGFGSSPSSKDFLNIKYKVVTTPSSTSRRT